MDDKDAILNVAQEDEDVDLPFPLNEFGDLNLDEFGDPDEIDDNNILRPTRTPSYYHWTKDNLIADPNNPKGLSPKALAAEQRKLKAAKRAAAEAAAAYREAISAELKNGTYNTTASTEQNNAAKSPVISDARVDTAEAAPAAAAAGAESAVASASGVVEAEENTESVAMGDTESESASALTSEIRAAESAEQGALPESGVESTQMLSGSLAEQASFDLALEDTDSAAAAPESTNDTNASLAKSEALPHTPSSSSLDAGKGNMTLSGLEESFEEQEKAPAPASASVEAENSSGASVAAATAAASVAAATGTSADNKGTAAGKSLHFSALDAAELGELGAGVGTGLVDEQAEFDPFAPLAARLRPRNIDEYIGQSHLLSPGKPLRQALEHGRCYSMILWGPPGVGKTTLAFMIARSTHAYLEQLSAVSSGVKEVREAIARAQARKRNGMRTILFVDEVHRFNKAQQDAFLPYIENGTVIFIGATTENPSFQVNSALLSRARVFVLKPLSASELSSLIDWALSSPRGLQKEQLVFDDKVRQALIELADGDARHLLTTLEMLSDDASPLPDGKKVITYAMVGAVAGRRLIKYDKGGDAFYDLISAFHKSVRGSSPDGALYWYARILEAGGDPLYVARRLLAIATEDVGLADPNAMQIALNAWDIFNRVGAAEGERAIAEAAVYMALAPKSNSIYTALKQARKDAAALPSFEVPLYLRNAPTKLMKSLGYHRGYRYAHDYPQAYAPGECFLPEELDGRSYYQPSDRGYEVYLGRMRAYLQERDAQASAEERRYPEHHARAMLQQLQHYNPELFASQMLESDTSESAAERSDLTSTYTKESTLSQSRNAAPAVAPAPVAAPAPDAAGAMQMQIALQGNNPRYEQERYSSTPIAPPPEMATVDTAAAAAAPYPYQEEISGQPALDAQGSELYPPPEGGYEQDEYSLPDAQAASLAAAAAGAFDPVPWPDDDGAWQETYDSAPAEMEQQLLEQYQELPIPPQDQAQGNWPNAREHVASWQGPAQGQGQEQRQNMREHSDPQQEPSTFYGEV